MRLTNTTAIPNGVVRDVLRFVCPSGVSGYDVKLNNATSGDLKGKAYWAGSGYHDRACPFVTLYVGPDKKFPSKGGWTVEGKGYLPRPWLANRTEALVYVAAHELRHLWQAKVPRGYRVWGARGRFSERDADAYALKMLRAWRSILRDSNHATHI